MKCEICGKEILRDSQCINYKYYHNDCIENLKQENKQLKEELEEYKNPIKYFKYANKNVVEENKQLKTNWIKLKEYVYNQIPTDKTVLTKHIKIFEVLDKMQELEQGSDSNE